jgi:hypothetical protein
MRERDCHVLGLLPFRELSRVHRLVNQILLDDLVPIDNFCLYTSATGISVCLTVVLLC